MNTDFDIMGSFREQFKGFSTALAHEESSVMNRQLGVAIDISDLITINDSMSGGSYSLNIELNEEAVNRILQENENITREDIELIIENLEKRLDGQAEALFQDEMNSIKKQIEEYIISMFTGKG